MKIGFIGTGVMGASMARHLMDAGHKLTVYNRTKAKAEGLLNAGAGWADTPADCARHQDAVITIVGYPKDVEMVYLGDEGILKAAKPGAYLIDMTTTSPALWQRVAAEAVKAGMHPLDAPVSGGDTGARNATLSIMVGGEKTDFDACVPLFETMGKNVVYTGPAGCGQHTKMANQIAIAGCVTGVAEAVRYGQISGLDPQNMLSCIAAGAAGSWQMSNNGPKMISGDYAPGFYIQHFIKDMRIAKDEAAQRGVELPVLDMVLSMYESLMEDGRGNDGTQAIIEWYQG